MPSVTFQPSGRTSLVDAGTSLLDAARAAGAALPASCGGRGTCGRCRVRILSGDAPARTGAEWALSPAETERGWRLACLVPVTEDLVVEDPPAPPEDRILTAFAGREPTVDPGVILAPLAPDAPSLADPAGDLERLARAAGLDRLRAGPDLLRTLPARLRRQDWRAGAVLRGDELLSLRPPGSERLLGLAVDLGTTTLAAALVDLADGRVLATAGTVNPQSTHGDDVVSRAGAAAESGARREELRALAARGVNDLLRITTRQADAVPAEVALVAAAGNTVMQHLLLGLDAAPITATPFVPTLTTALDLPARAAGLHAGEGARLLVLPAVSGYIGGDIVAGLLAHGVHDRDGATLFIDVGTNGEIVLRAGGRTLACSTAAGPAFEGARIRCGMRATTGAVHRVAFDGNDLVVSVLGDGPARGLCGTGLLDAVAGALRAGLLDETGRMTTPGEAGNDPGLPPPLRARCVRTESGPALRLVPGAGGAPDVILTQADVREFQLAKGAVAAGVERLLAAAEVPPEAIDAVVLAGGFGSGLDPESARATGLLPETVPSATVRPVGNAALAGARLALLDRAAREEAARIAREVRYLELSGRPDFADAFARHMSFPDPA